MQIETKYVTKDGKKFDNQAEAEKHETELDKQADDRYVKFINGNAGRRLLSEHSSTAEGYWQAIGEADDPGPGGGRGPNLGLYKGRLVDVIRKVTAMNGFWAWGGGGSITKVNVIEL